MAHIFGDDLYADGKTLSGLCPFHHDNKKTTDGMTKRDKDLAAPVLICEEFSYLGQSAIQPSVISDQLHSLIVSPKSVHLITNELASHLMAFIKEYWEVW